MDNFMTGQSLFKTSKKAPLSSSNNGQTANKAINQSSPSRSMRIPGVNYHPNPYIEYIENKNNNKKSRYQHNLNLQNRQQSDQKHYIQQSKVEVIPKDNHGDFTINILPSRKLLSQSSKQSPRHLKIKTPKSYPPQQLKLQSDSVLLRKTSSKVFEQAPVQNSPRIKNVRQSFVKNQDPNILTLSKEEDKILNDQTSFHSFNHTKIQLTGYLGELQSQLQSYLLSLRKIQSKAENTLENNIENECQKMRAILIKVIDKEIQSFKAQQIYDQSQNKVHYMSEVYEIKDQINQRIRQIEYYSQELEYGKWKEVTSLITQPDFESSISELANQSSQLINLSGHSIEQYMNQYRMGFTQKITQYSKNQFEKALRFVFDSFSRQKKLKKPKKKIIPVRMVVVEKQRQARWQDY